MVYQWKETSRIKADPQVAGEICEKLAETVGLSAKTLLEASREESAPLHGEFEWDDGLAAEKYREDQARYIIRNLCFKVEDKPHGEKEAPVRVFFKVREKSNDYDPLPVIVKEKDKREKLLEAAKKDMTAIQQKYSAIEEVVKALEVGLMIVEHKGDYQISFPEAQ